MDENIDEMDDGPSRELALPPEVDPGGGADIAAEPVAALEPVKVPLIALKAALSCTGAKGIDPDGKRHDVPYHLQGVNIASRHGELRVSATDSRRLFAFSMPCRDTLPDWLEDGVTISLALLKDQLGLIEKLDGEAVIVSYQKEAPRVVLSDQRENVTFRDYPIDGEFPDYDKLLGGVDLSARTTLDLDSTAYQAAYLKGVADLAKLLGSATVQVFGSAGAGKPVLITFPGCPGAVLVLMPLIAETTIAPQTARVIEGAIAGTLAALKAHRTRWERKLAKLPNSTALKKKVAEYDARIDALVARTAPALPAPVPPDDDEVAFGDSDSAALGHPARPELPVGDADPDAFKARLLAQKADRSKLKAGAAKNALAKYAADTNAALSREHDGLTLSQLADGVPLEGWWEAGLSPEEAAKRCLDWRRVETALPADEVGPPMAPMGEGDEPIAAVFPDTAK